MPERVELDMKEFEGLIARLQAPVVKRMSEPFFRKEAANLVELAVERTKARTPQGLEELRRHWTAAPVKRNGNCYDTYVRNDLPDASDMEYGRRVKKQWIGGYMMMTKSLNSVRDELPDRLLKDQARWIERLWEGERG